ncbi:MAG: hypothetical protein ACI8WB_002475 [Phenylobacterium sp.]|jgi:hypothetical protein
MRLLLLTFWLLMMGQAQAADQPNLLIMGDDGDHEGIARDSRVFARVLDALSNQLQDIGFDVFDETALVLAHPQSLPQQQTRRNDGDIIDIARAIQHPPIDIVVLFSIYASANRQGSLTKVRIRIAGRLLNVRTGQRLGNFEVVSPERYHPGASCERECLLETIGDHSKALASNLGSELAQKLNWLAGGHSDGSELLSAFTLVFDNFSPDDMAAIEEYLVVFSGYHSHRPIYNSMTRAELWYQTRIHAAKLSRNLHKMLAQLALRGIVQFSGNTYTVQKIILANAALKVST